MPALCGETPAGAIWEQLCPVKTQGSSARGQTRLRKQQVTAELSVGLRWGLTRAHPSRCLRSGCLPAPLTHPGSHSKRFTRPEFKNRSSAQPGVCGLQCRSTQWFPDPT
ncbi:uncharacterized protein LOC123328934 isoform X2 [Bubalus bubalis]|uniref:uncharacterized protein LOC123328934 isoform X2 n=1 Tax=Bubalus bubalis TaxID=89462 RepID=UPI001E1B61C1|nr:uncharacterized protein LOC123328934 isoform X2 [Bubalus bubalis]